MRFFKFSIFIFLISFMPILYIGCKSDAKPFESAEELKPLPDGEQLWTAEIDKSMDCIISPPEDIPCFTQYLLNRAEKGFGEELLPGRILTWSEDISLATGALELYIEKGAAKILDARLIYLIRMKVSYFVSCPFAIDVNSWKYADYQITTEEIMGLQGNIDLRDVSSFTERELTALLYAEALSQTPVSFSGELLGNVRRLFSQEEIVAISSLAAKVNFWARLIEAWRIKPVGYSNDPILRIDEFTTFNTIQESDND